MEGDRGRQDLSEWAEHNLSGLDHVGSTTHFEGCDTQRLAQAVRTTLAQLGLEYREEEARADRPTHTFLAQPQRRSRMVLWVKVSDRGGVVAVAETRLIHATEESAFADEYLSEFISQLEQNIGQPPQQ